VRSVVDAKLARQGLGRWWAGRLGLLLIPALFSLPSAFPLPWVGFRGQASWIFVLPAGFAGSGEGGLSDGILLALLLVGASRGSGRAGLLLTPHRTLPPW
jgi:hypothetical protein